MIITNDEQTFGIFMEDVDNDIENNNDDLDDNNNEENNLEDNDEGPSSKDKIRFIQQNLFMVVVCI